MRLETDNGVSKVIEGGGGVRKAKGREDRKRREIFTMIFVYRYSRYVCNIR